VGKAITYQNFLKLQAHYYDVLKEGYLKVVAEADNKDYAAKHYQALLFAENPKVMQGTALFRELFVNYDHLSRIKAERGFYQTLELLEEIREISRRELEQAINFQRGNKEIELSCWYQEQINAKIVTIDELIHDEIKIQGYTDGKLVEALALKLAGSKLLKEFQKEDTPVEVKTNHRYQFSQKEQLLGLAFLIQSFGVNLSGQCYRTDMAGLFHLIMGVSYHDEKKLKDLGIYKGLAVTPQVVKSDKQLLKYLEKLKPLLFKANFHDAVSLVDKQIARCKRELE